MQCPELLEISAEEFSNEVRRLLAAFRYPQLLLQSPFYASKWVTAALVSGEFADRQERIQTLQAALCWAVRQLAPESTNPPAGSRLTLDDPAWTDSGYWSYIIIRYRFLEPIPPDEYFEGTRLVGTIIARTGIPGRNAYYSELNRAVRDLSIIIRNAMEERRSSAAILRFLLARIQEKLRLKPSAMAVLGVASTFPRGFPRRLLMEMAEREGISDSFRDVEYLINENYLVEIDSHSHLTVPPALRHYMAQQQPMGKLRPRHLAAARYARACGQVPDEIMHLQNGGAQHEACRKVLDYWGALTTRCGFDELLGLLDGFQQDELTQEERVWVQVCRGSHFIRFGFYDKGKQVFKDLLHSADNSDVELLSNIFLGHICSHIDPESAHRYFGAAEAMKCESSPYARFLYSSLGRFHLMRDETSMAQKYLLKALKVPDHPFLKFTSVLLFALTDLYVMKKEFDLALNYGTRLLEYAESEQDAHLVALALGIQGKISMAAGNHPVAMRYFKKSETLHRNRFNLNEVSRILNYQGAVFAETGHDLEAVAAYEESIACYERQGITSREKASVHKELSRLYSRQERTVPACRHWMLALRLAEQLGLQATFFKELDDLRKSIKGFESVTGPCPALQPIMMEADRKVLEIADRVGYLTSHILVTTLGIGRTKAHAILKRLAESGRLIRTGKGRKTRYRLLGSPTDTHVATGRDVFEIPYMAEKIMGIVGKLGFITTLILQKRADVSRSSAKRELAELVAMGLLKRAGAARSTRYVIPY